MFGLDARGFAFLRESTQDARDSNSLPVVLCLETLDRIEHRDIVAIRVPLFDYLQIDLTPGFPFLGVHEGVEVIVVVRQF